MISTSLFYFQLLLSPICLAYRIMESRPRLTRRQLVRVYREALAARHRTAAPVRFCTGACEPIRCYSPAAQTFPEFLSTAGGWIELRPVRETVRYDIGGALPSGDGQDFFSELLQCRYRARQTADGLLIELFDSPESFRARTQRLSDSFTAALALQWELTALGYPNDSK